MSDLVAVALAVALLAANAFFVGAEFSLVAARRTKIEPIADTGSARARRTLTAMRKVSLMMAGAQLGITICSLGLGAVGEPAVAHLIEPPLEALGTPEGWLHPIAFVLALMVVVTAHVVIGEMVPKNLALADPERSALALGPALASLVRALRPIIVTLNAMANGVLRLIGVQPTEEVSTAATGEELADLVEESHREGLMDSEEHSRVRETLAFAARTARDAMIERADVQVLPADATPAQVEELAGSTGHSRFALADAADARRTWTRYVHLKDVLEVEEAGLDDPDRTVSRELPAVEADTPLLDVLAAMRDDSTHVLRVDEVDGSEGTHRVGDAAGGSRTTVGLVTLDDVLITLFPAEGTAPGATAGADGDPRGREGSA